MQLASTKRLELSGYATGGGICALMNVRPDVEGLCSPIAEEVTQGDKGTCPGSLITGGLCQGSSDFPLGRRQGGACRDIEPSATQFVDRHSTQLKNVSILHEADRNPKSLNQCQQTCDQHYFFRSADKEVELGRFQIVYDYRKRPGTGVVATDVTDNYMLFVGGDADKFASNEKTIDEIWGSFGMYSGGFSGNS